MERPQSRELYELHATICQAIADPNRIALLYELGSGPRHVNELVEALDLPQATVSRHLKILRDRALVTTERDGAYIYYELAYPQVLQALDIMRGVMATSFSRRVELTEVE